MAWLSRLSDINGEAKVYVDGTLIGTVNTFSSAVQPKRVVFTRKFSTVATHTLKIVVVGTPGPCEGHDRPVLRPQVAAQDAIRRP